MGVDGPHNAKYRRRNSGHAEPEQHAGDEKFVSSGHVDSENRHVGCSADHEEDEKNGAYGHIKTDCWQAAEGCGGSWVGRMHGHSTHSGSLGRNVSVK